MENMTNDEALTHVKRVIDCVQETFEDNDLPVNSRNFIDAVYEAFCEDLEFNGLDEETIENLWSAVENKVYAYIRTGRA